MAKISSYAAVVTPADADVVPVVQSGVTKKLALSVLKTYIGNVSSADISTIVKCTQAEYDALSPVDENTLYIIVEA